MDLVPYFKKHLGKKAQIEAMTGETLYTKVYARLYTLEIVAVDESKGQVMFGVRSEDIVPSGYTAGGTNKLLPSVTVEVQATNEDTLKSAVQKADPEFFKVYGSKITWR